MAAIPQGWRAPIADFARHLELMQGRAWNTVKAYRLDMEELARWAGSVELDPADVTYPDLRAWLAALHKAGQAPATRARKSSSCRVFFAWAARTGVVATDPAEHLGTPKAPRQLPKPLKPEAVLAMLNALDTSTPAGLRDRALIELLYATGARVAEACGTNLDHVDLSQRQVLLNGKGDRQRIVPFGEPCAVALTDYLTEARPALKPKASIMAVFLAKRGGQRLAVRGAYDAVRDAGRAAGHTGVHPHRLRASCATHMLDGGADISAIAEMLGHSALTTTAGYLAVSTERMRLDYDAAFDSQRRQQ